MEDKIESLDLEDNGDRRPDSPVRLCIGSEHQAEIPDLFTEDERCELMASSLDGSLLHGYGYPVVVGLPLPIMWASQSELEKKEEELQMQEKSETEAFAGSRGEESQVTSICPTSNNASKCDPTYQDPRTLVPVAQIESDNKNAHYEEMALFPAQEGLMNNQMMRERGAKPLNPLPYPPIVLWSDLEAEVFLLGLYIFGKNLNLVTRFLGTKTKGDVISYYYGKFYKRDAYKRWADCRKARNRKCILGERIFQGSRQQELISRLKSEVPKEVHDSLIEVFKSFSDSQISLEDFVFTLKSTVGTEAFVEAVGVGKGKRDLTGYVMDPSKSNQSLSVHPDLSTGKDCSSLSVEEIINFLTGDFRKSKSQSIDIFWDAVWPRLLAKGWHSEQTKDFSTTKSYIVFLVPGVKKFSRSKLTKGTHYFDSFSDVLKKVSADPVLIGLESDGINNIGLAGQENGSIADMNLSHDSPLDGYQELPKFTIIDTSLVEGEEPFKVRELRNLPADANINFVLSHHSSNMMSDSSSEEQDASDRFSDNKGDCGRVTADVKDIKMVSAGSLQNSVTANGHSSVGNDEKVCLTSIYGTKTKAERRKYLSPVSKRRRLASCSNEQTSRRGFSFSKGGGLVKEKTKSLPTSSKSIAVDAGDTFQTRTIASCSTKEKPSEQKMGTSNSLTNEPNERIGMANFVEDKSLERKVDAVAEGHSKITVDREKNAKERAQASGQISSNKLGSAHDDKAGGSACIMLSDNHGGMKVNEAPSTSNSKMVRDPSEATEEPDSQQPELSLQANPRRHGTRNRPPTAKALEAVAFGLLGSGKRKGDPKNTATSRPSQRARKSTKDSGPRAASGDSENSSMDAEVQH